MGEHKHPKPEHPRPNIEIIRLKQAVTASKGEPMDRDTAAFLAELSAALAWIDHLEAERPAPVALHLPPKPTT